MTIVSNRSFSADEPISTILVYIYIKKKKSDTSNCTQNNSCITLQCLTVQFKMLNFDTRLNRQVNGEHEYFANKLPKNNLKY